MTYATTTDVRRDYFDLVELHSTRSASRGVDSLGDPVGSPVGEPVGCPSRVLVSLRFCIFFGGVGVSTAVADVSDVGLCQFSSS